MSLRTIKTTYGNIRGCEVGDMMVLGRVADAVDKELHPEEYTSVEQKEVLSIPRAVARTALKSEINQSL